MKCQDAETPGDQAAAGEPPRHLQECQGLETSGSGGSGGGQGRLQGLEEIGADGSCGGAT